MQHTSGKNHRQLICLITAVLVINLLAITAVGIKESGQIRKELLKQAQETEEQFNGVMDNYRHSFRLFSELMTNEIRNNPDPDHLWDFLKSIDSTMLEIEGETFDGLYMYYKGRYLYSWDTPYSQYEDTGYNAVERPWYKDAVEGQGSIVFTPPYKSYANNYILTTLSQLQPDNETVYAYDIKMGDIQNLVSSPDRFEGEQILIFDRNGTVIGSTKEEYLGGSLYPNSEDADQSPAFPAFRDELNSHIPSLTSATTQVLTVKLGKSHHYAILTGQDDYYFLVLVPIASMLKSTMAYWLVPMLLVELLLIYALGRISKEMKNRELHNAYVELGQMQKRLEVALSAAQKAAAIDDLTGMMNFKSFRAELEKSLRCMDKNDRGILIMIDGDHFKQINDNYGHSTGDEVIRLSAQMIVGRIRIVDLASRLHGDEFAIFVSNSSDLNVAKNIMKDINQSIAKEAKKRNLPSITLSAGAVVAGQTDSYTALAKAADAALYKAKETHNGGFAS